MFILSQTWFAIIAVTVFIHWLLPSAWRGYWIVLCSVAYLGWKSPESVLMLSFCTLVVYLLTRDRDRISGKSLIALIITIGGLLFFYKARASLALGAAIDLTPHVEKYIIPLGLSYYTFRCIHYGIEKYKGTIPRHGPGELVQYLFFLPTFTAGPIHRFPEFHRDLQRKRWDPFMFAQGLERMLFGYFKVTFLANLLVTNLFGLYITENFVDESSAAAYLKMIGNALNLYFQFAGYSDIAIGFGMLLGIKVMENFNFPFLARNISDFWTRWHISLTSWCRDYVYMGTVAVTRNTALAALAAMIVMGLWHELSVRFLVWGLYHGLGIMIWQRFQDIKPHLPQVKNALALKGLGVLSTLLTLHWFMFGVLIAHHKQLPVALHEMQKILFFWL